MNGRGVCGGVPGLHLALKPWEHQLLQDVVHDPVGEEGHPQLEEVHQGDAVEARGPHPRYRPTQEWHPDLPH